MMTTMILGSVLAILNIAAIIFLIVVLIKQFSKGGVLQGILGIITCGLWTFIWGWIKHRQYQLTRVMTMWSIAYVASMVIGVMFGGVIGMEMAKLMGEASGEFKAEIEKQTSPQPAGGKKINLPGRKKTAKTNRPATRNTPGPDDPERLASAAMGLWQNGRYTNPEIAVDQWSEVIQARPDSAEAYNNRGIGHHGAGRYVEAINDFDRAIRMKADYAVAFNNRGNARYEMANYQEALADYAASLRIDPRYANAYANRGLAYFRLNRQPQACQDFQKACDLGSCDMLRWAVSQQICK